MCPIDDKGRTRTGFKFIGAYFGSKVNEIGVEDYRDLESEGIEYEDTDVNNIGVNYNFGSELLNQSIGSFE